MACEYCYGEGFHNSRCPLYEFPKATHCCSVCGEGIYEGEEYLENDDGDYRHFDCFYDNRALLEWLGYSVKVMEDEN